MKQHEPSSTPQSGEEYIYNNSKSSQQQDEETIDICTMDPCPMKMMPKDDLPVKCPHCGKMEKSGMTSRNILNPEKDSYTSRTWKH